MAKRKRPAKLPDAGDLYAVARRTYESLCAELMDEYETELDLVREAWADFTGGAGELDPEDPDGEIFFDWLLWHIRFEADNGEFATMPAILAATDPTAFDPAEHDFIERSQRAALSFFTVLATTPGDSLAVRDMLVEDEFLVTERSASEILQPGDMVFGSVQALADVNLFLAIGAAKIPPKHGLPIVTLRKELRKRYGTITRERIQADDLELLRLYRNILQPLREPIARRMANTDGDPLEFRKLHFELNLSPADAVQKLAALTHLETADVIMARGAATGAYDIAWTVRGARGGKKAATDHTIFGQIRVSAGQVVASVNSARRETEVRKLIEKQLTRSVRYRATAIESMEAAMRAAEARSQRGPPEPDLSQSPEIRAILAEHVRLHYERWLDDKIPALGNRTPREAARDPDLREVLEGLLQGFERMDSGDDINAAPVDRLRAELNLPRGGK